MSKQDKNKPSFSKFGKDFQESLCQLILVDRPFADQIMEVLDENFLELHYLRVFVRLIMDYREKYTVHPTYKIMISVLRASLDEEDAATSQQLRNYFAKIFKTDVSGAEYIKTTALAFCRKQMLKDISQYGILIILAVTVAVVTVTLVIKLFGKGL